MSHCGHTPGRGSIDTVNQPNARPAKVPSISIAHLPAELSGDVVLLDVREHDEWAAGHAPEAVHIPMGEIPGRLGELSGDEVYVICRSGGRSARVTAYLNANGWDATNVDGGMGAWHAAGRTLVGEIDGVEPRVI